MQPSNQGASSDGIDRSRSIAHRLAYCRHYSGRGANCKLGIDFRSIKRVQPAAGKPRWAPCIDGNMISDACSICPSYSPHTQEEAEAYADQVQASLLRMTLVNPFVSQWRKREPIGKAEIVPCPVCGGRLHLSQAACNGHVRGKCETAGCVAWIE